MARILQQATALAVLFTEIRYTLSRLRAHPLGAPYVSTFENLRNECIAVHNTEFGMLETQTDAQASVDIADETLNDLATRFSRTLLTLTGGNRNHPIFAFYFDSTPLADFKRPILGEQLKKMTRWVSALPSADPSLQAMGPELSAAVTAGQQAADAKEQATGQRREFRELGARRQLVDRLNGARKEVHGALAKLPHQHPHLPTNFADQFFRRDPSQPEEDDGPVTVEAVQLRIETLRAETIKAEKQLAELKAEAEAEQQAEKERAEKKEAIAELDRTMAELKTKRAAMVSALDES